MSVHAIMREFKRVDDLNTQYAMAQEIRNLRRMVAAIERGGNIITPIVTQDQDGNITALGLSVSSTNALAKLQQGDVR